MILWNGIHSFLTNSHTVKL